MVEGVGHLGHVEAMEAGGREFSLHGQVVKGVGHIGHVEVSLAEPIDDRLHNRLMGRHFEYFRTWTEAVISTITPLGI